MHLLTKDGHKIGITIYTPVKGASDILILLFLHGTAVNRNIFRPLFENEKLLKENIVGITVDYREYGDSSGDFTREGVLIDIETVLVFIHQEFPNSEINIIAHSFGTGIFLEYVKNSNSRKLYKKAVLIGAFTSLIAVCEIKMLWNILSLLPMVKNTIEEEFLFDSINNIKKLDFNDIFIVHGKNDIVVPVKHAYQFIEVTNSKHFISDDGHTDILFKNDTWNKIFEFLDKK